MYELIKSLNVAILLCLGGGKIAWSNLALLGRQGRWMLSQKVLKNIIPQFYAHCEVPGLCNVLAKSFLMLVTVRAGGDGGLRNACETASVKPPKCWNALLTSKHLELGTLNSTLGSWILQWQVPFCCIWEHCAGRWFSVSSTPSTSHSCISSVSSFSVLTLPICCCLHLMLPLALLLPLVSVQSWTGTLCGCGLRGACLPMTLVTMLRLWVATSAACVEVDGLLSIASKNWKNFCAQAGISSLPVPDWSLECPLLYFSFARRCATPKWRINIDDCIRLKHPRGPSDWNKTD